MHCYSVKLPFRADRLGLRENPKWLKVIADVSDKRIMWSDNVHKINRATGKVRMPLIKDHCNMWLYHFRQFRSC